MKACECTAHTVRLDSFLFDILKIIYRDLDNFQHSQNKKYDISQIVLTLTIIAYDVKNPLTFSLDNVGKFVKEGL